MLTYAMIPSPQLILLLLSHSDRCSRLCCCETTFTRKRLVTQLPDTRSLLPIEEEDFDKHARRHRSEIGASWDHILPTVGCFGREAQAMFLLDQVLSIADAGGGKYRSREEVSRIDQDLRSLLYVLLAQCRGVRGLCCGAIAIVLR